MGAIRTKADRPGKKTSRPAPDQSRPETRIDEVCDVFKSVGDPACLGILLALGGGARSGAEIGAAIGLKHSDIIYQIALLRHVGLISQGSPEGHDFYSLTERGRRVAGLAQSLAHDDQPRDEAPEISSIEPALLADVGGFVEDPVGWFLTRNPEFLWRRPIELLNTPDEQILRERIEAAKYGLFS